MAGFTTIRNVGAPNFDDMALRKAINDGFVEGPAHAERRARDRHHRRPLRRERIQARLAWTAIYRTGIADGPDQIRAAVRYQAKYGADVIKTCATGGVLSEGDAVGVPQYTYEEMKALVDEATKLERKVAAHAHGTEGIKIAVRAGVVVDRARLVPRRRGREDDGRSAARTSCRRSAPARRSEKAAKAGVLKGLRAEKARAAAAAMRNGVKIAVRNGVPIALGTDAGVGPHGANGHEFTLMVEWGGMTPMQSIVAGTMNGAKLLGWDNRIGSLPAGKLADVVAVPGDPLAGHSRHGEAGLRDEERGRLQGTGRGNASISYRRRDCVRRGNEDG